MKVIKNKTFDEERALYGSVNVRAENCRFDGPADGESAFKERRNIEAADCYFNLRYPFWHDTDLKISDCELTPLCRAAIWYSRNVTINNTKLLGIKALRECRDVTIADSDILSAEFGWFSRKIRLSDCKAEGEYFMFNASELEFSNVIMKGKYSFQYIENAVFDNCVLDTKDAFWHAKNVVVRNSLVKGEYLGWYSENVSFENCVISGTQPLCYCKGLRLVDCEMNGADLSFEKSEVDATLRSRVISVKNPTAGRIVLPGAEEIIRDDPSSLCEIVIG